MEGSRICSPSITTFVASACALFVAAVLVQASDPDPLQDFCVADLSKNVPHVNGFPCKQRAMVTSKDFMYTGLRKAAKYTASDTSAAITLATVTEYPALNTFGLSHLRIDFNKGGVVPPHTHPFASETIYIVEGTIYTGFVSFDNILYAETLHTGDIYLFPKGSLHFQINVGPGIAITFNTLTSQNPGFLFMANQLFETNITSAVLEQAFGVSEKMVESIKGSVPRTWG